MMRISLILALGVMLGFAMPGAKHAQAASGISLPALPLGQQVTNLQQSPLMKADVGFHLYIGPRRRYYRRWRRRRGPRFRLYIGPRYRHYRRYRRRGGCRYWHRRCVRNWGYRTNSYYGCMRYHGCR